MLDHDTILSVANHCYPRWERLYEEDVLFGLLSPAIRDRRWMKLGELLGIAGWKSRFAVRYAEGNDPEVVGDLTRRAFEQADAGEAAPAVRSLVRDGNQGLHGVQTPMASAILTVYDKKAYTVMDRRAWASLAGLDEVSGKAPYTPEGYADYLRVCTGLSRAHGVTLRELDRCLWALKGQTVEQMRGERCIRDGKPGCGRGKRFAEHCPCASSRER